MAPESPRRVALRKPVVGRRPESLVYRGRYMRQERGRRDRERPVEAGIACVILRHNPCPDQTSAFSGRGRRVAEMQLWGALACQNPRLLKGKTWIARAH
jgi:hypothetical protein